MPSVDLALDRAVANPATKCVGTAAGDLARRGGEDGNGDDTLAVDWMVQLDMDDETAKDPAVVERIEAEDAQRMQQV